MVQSCDLIAKAVKVHDLRHDELVQLLQDNQAAPMLFEAADKVREKYVGNEVHLRALIEFSNHCRNNCRYCGLRKDNSNLIRYRLDEDTIFKMAEYAVVKMGLKTVVLQSGEDLWFNRERMCSIIKRIKTLDTALTLSIGEKSLSEYQAYKEAGCDRFLLRIETTDKAVYDLHHPNMDWEKRAQCLTDLRNAGIEVGSGCLVGLPGQTTASLADDILFFKKIDADMIGIGPFIPHPDTPLKEAPGRTFELAAKVMALTRLLLPDINIPATTAMETLAPNGQIRALQAGANVIMPNVTLTEFRKHYELYPGKSSTNYTADKSLSEVRQRIEQLGRTISHSKGFHSRHI